MDQTLGETMPALDPGVTWLIDASDRSTAHHQLVLEHLASDRGQVLWIDARDTASTYALHALARRPRLLDPIRIARAWTAYQHHSLVRRLVERASDRTRLVVLPHVCSLYRDDDLADQEATQLLASTLETLAALADALAVPVLLTAPETERQALDPVTDRELTCEATEQGYTFVGESFRTTIYHTADGWQTTIPYWVELLGALQRGEDDPWEIAAAHAGLESVA